MARGKDVFGIMPTGFAKRLIFQLFPRLAKAALTLENSTIIVFSPLISLMRDQVEQLKKLGFLATAIGITEEEEDDEKKVRQGKCEIVFGSLESRLVKKWQKQNSPKTVKLIPQLPREKLYALLSKDSHYFRRNTIQLEFTKSQCNSP